jgi:hypothetical protein
MQPLGKQPLAFTIKHTNLVDKLLTEVYLTEAFDPANPPSGNIAPHKTRALWDTGATRSFITHSTAKALKLIAIGSTKYIHAGGTGQCDSYLINIFLPNGVAVTGVMVNDCADKTEFGAIIGMDIISMGDFSITNVKNQTWLSYRIPSLKPIDYVVEGNKIIFAGVSRNTPCPCGATDKRGVRLKFKDCHKKQI